MTRHDDSLFRGVVSISAGGYEWGLLPCDRDPRHKVLLEQDPGTQRTYDPLNDADCSGLFIELAQLPVNAGSILDFVNRRRPVVRYSWH